MAAVWDGVCLQLSVDGQPRAEVARIGRLGEGRGPILIGQGFKGRIVFDSLRLAESAPTVTDKARRIAATLSLESTGTDVIYALIGITRGL